jgi:hypothetical protein
MKTVILISALLSLCLHADDHFKNRKTYKKCDDGIFTYDGEPCPDRKTYKKCDDGIFTYDGEPCPDRKTYKKCDDGIFTYDGEPCPKRDILRLQGCDGGSVSHDGLVISCPNGKTYRIDTSSTDLHRRDYKPKKKKALPSNSEKKEKKRRWSRPAD